MNHLLESLEHTLLTRYEPGYANLYVEKIKKDTMTVEEFKKQIPDKLPELFYEFYQWMASCYFPMVELSDQTYMLHGQQMNRSLSEIASTTKTWKQIKKADPSREWKEGFVPIASWDSAYEMVIDTKGMINGKKNILAYWDFKGGAYYVVRYPDFESYLKTQVRLLQDQLYFAPPLFESEKYEDFMYGETSRRKEAIITEINSKPEYIAFL